MSDEFDADDVPPPPPAPAPPPPPPPPPPAAPEPPTADFGDLSTGDVTAPIAGVDATPAPPPIAGVDISPSAVPPSAPPSAPAAPPPPPPIETTSPPPPPPVEAPIPTAPPPPPSVEAAPAPPPPPLVEPVVTPAPVPPSPAAEVPAPAAPAAPAAAPAPAQPMPDAAAGPGVTDPAGLGAAVSRLSGGSRKAGNAAFMVMANALEAGETVAVVAQCRFRGAPGAIALTDRRLLVVNAREWEPDVLPVGLETGLAVHGWQDERRAALVFSRAGHDVVVDQIGDRAMAQEIAVGVRDRTGG